MNRRNFLGFLGKAAVGGAVAYSFPKIIVPKNIELIDQINLITKKEIYPSLIEDIFFNESPWFARLRDTYVQAMSSGPEPNLIVTNITENELKYLNLI